MTAGTFITRKLPELEALYQPALPAERDATLAQKNKQLKSAQSPAVLKKGLQQSDHADKCTDGDPVNSVTGEVLLVQSDFTLPGRLPLTWSRHYSSQSAYSGLLGLGWQTQADARLELDADNRVLFYNGSPGGAVFEKLPVDQPIMEASDGAELSATEDLYQVTLKSGQTFYFAKTFAHNQSFVTRISETCCCRFVLVFSMVSCQTSSTNGTQTLIKTMKGYRWPLSPPGFFSLSNKPLFLS